MSTPPFDPNDPLRQIIRVDQMRGLDAELTIVDAEELAASLTEAGLHEAQVEALRRTDLSLQTYVQLVELEMACLRGQGIEPSPMEVSTLAYGVRQPTYGYPAEVPGMTDDEISRIQITCQNRFTGAYQTLYAAKFTPSPDEALALRPRSSQRVPRLRAKPGDRSAHSGGASTTRRTSTPSTPGTPRRKPTSTASSGHDQDSEADLNLGL